MDDRNEVKKYQVKKAHFGPLCKCAQKWLKRVYHFAENNNRISFSMVYVFFMHDLFMPNNLDVLTKKQMLNESKGLLHKSHNAPVPYPTIYHFVTNMHIAVAIWCIVGYLSDALW